MSRANEIEYEHFLAALRKIAGGNSDCDCPLAAETLRKIARDTLNEFGFTWDKQRGGLKMKL